MVDVDHIIGRNMYMGNMDAEDLEILPGDHVVSFSLGFEVVDRDRIKMLRFKAEEGETYYHVEENEGILCQRHKKIWIISSQNEDISGLDVKIVCR